MGVQRHVLESSGSSSISRQPLFDEVFLLARIARSCAIVPSCWAIGVLGLAIELSETPTDVEKDEFLGGFFYPGPRNLSVLRDRESSRPIVMTLF